MLKTKLIEMMTVINIRPGGQKAQTLFCYLLPWSAHHLNQIREFISEHGSYCRSPHVSLFFPRLLLRIWDEQSSACFYVFHVFLHCRIVTDRD